MKTLAKMKKKMARKLKTENGKPMGMTREDIQDIKEEIEENEEVEDEE